VKKGETEITLWNGSRKVKIALPFDGTLEEVNNGLSDAPGVMNEEPYGRGWMARLSLDDSEDVQELLHGKEAREWLREDLEALHTTTEKELGLVLADGGEPLKNFSQNLEDDEWYRLVGLFLNRKK
jgi:hypothetical protein